jgi:hypothetical protein
VKRQPQDAPGEPVEGRAARWLLRLTHSINRLTAARSPGPVR